MTQRDVEADGDRPPSDPGQDGGYGAGQNGGEAAQSAGNVDRPDDAGSHPAPGDRSEVAELEDRWRRALADLDNLRKRYSRELPRERAAERERVAAAFLPVIDNIDLALQHADAARGGGRRSHGGGHRVGVGRAGGTPRVRRLGTVVAARRGHGRR